jgi:AcrR family transcriptional regulator
MRAVRPVERREKSRRCFPSKRCGAITRYRGVLLSTRAAAVPGKTKAFDDKLQVLLKAAATIFAAKGYEGTSIRDISRQSKIGLSNIYYYISCKEELLYLIQYNTFDALLRTALDGTAAVDDPEQRLRIIVRNHVQHFATNMAELKVCARELGTLKGGYYEEVRRIRKEYFDVVLGAVRELTGRYRSTLDPWLAAANIFGMLNWFYQWYELKAGKTSPEALAGQQLELILWGIKGRDHPPEPTREEVDLEEENR